MKNASDQWQKRSSPLIVSLSLNMSVETSNCTFKAGSGHFNYMLGLHHLFCKKKQLDFKNSAICYFQIITKTSMPQTWHIPQRQYGISAEAVEDIKVLKQIEKERMVLNLNFIACYNTCCVSIAT